MASNKKSLDLLQQKSSSWLRSGTRRPPNNLSKIQSKSNKSQPTRKLNKKTSRNPVVKHVIAKRTERKRPTLNLHRKIYQEPNDLDALHASSESFKPQQFNLPIINIWPCDEIKKDCKHLTLDQIDESFQQHKEELSKIINGEVYNERNEKFLQRQTGLTYTMVLFDYDQIEFMINSMIREFDPTDQLLQYFVKVLVPEFTMMVFMDTYHMTREEAERYLQA